MDPADQQEFERLEQKLEAYRAENQILKQTNEVLKGSLKYAQDGLAIAIEKLEQVRDKVSDNIEDRIEGEI